MPQTPTASVRWSMSLCKAAMLSALFLAACGAAKSASAVNGARNALTDAALLVSTRPVIIRPSASLGTYVGLYLSGDDFQPANAARMGVMAQMQLHAKPTQDQINATFDLLQEFGTVLQVDIADLLNRSDNRLDTLNQYVEGLANITARSQRKADEVKAQVDTLKTEEQTKQKTVSQINSTLQKALQTKDYATAGEQQQLLGQAETDLAQTDTQLKQQNQILTAFLELLKVAAERSIAIDQNRAILIAGLKVVNVPGAQGLGVLEQQQNGYQSIFGQ